MSRALHCDNSFCNTWQKMNRNNIEYPPHADWITMTTSRVGDELHFCSWRCVRTFADEKLPVTA